jgi:hypothetical protein
MTKINSSNEYIRRIAYSRIDLLKYYQDESMLELSKTTSLSDGSYDICPTICSSHEKYKPCNAGGHSQHCSVIFKGKLDDKDVLCYGQNKFTSKGTSIHAEEDVINKLKPKKRSNLISVDMLVIKVKRDGTLSNSLPCVHCLRTIADMPVVKGYKINKVYYSNDNGDIECQKLHDLINSNNLHVSSYYRNTKYNMNKWYQWRFRYNRMYK